MCDGEQSQPPEAEIYYQRPFFVQIEYTGKIVQVLLAAFPTSFLPFPPGICCGAEVLVLDARVLAYLSWNTGNLAATWFASGLFLDLSESSLV